MRKSRLSAPPPSTLFATRAAYQRGSFGLKVRLPARMFDCTEPARCTRTISVAVRTGGVGAAVTGAGAPVQPLNALDASRVAVARSMSPASTSSAPEGRRRLRWNPTTSARVIAFVDAGDADAP